MPDIRKFFATHIYRTLRDLGHIKEIGWAFKQITEVFESVFKQEASGSLRRKQIKELEESGLWTTTLDQNFVARDRILLAWLMK